MVAPEDEIEITPAMIEAGMKIMLTRDSRFGDTDREDVADIFREMFRIMAEGRCAP